MSQWHAHNSTLAFHTLHIGQRDTRIFPYLVSSAIFYSLPLSQTRSLYLFPLSLFHPTPVRFRRCRRLLPCPWQVKYRLLPPTYTHPHPQCPICFLIQVQKQWCSYELRNLFLNSTNVLLHHIKYRLLPCRRLQCVFPFTVCTPPQEPPLQSLRHLVLETYQDPDHAGGDHPCFCAEKQHRLDHSFKEKSLHLRHFYLPANNPCQPPPHRLRLFQVSDYRRTIVVRLWNHLAQVFEGIFHKKTWQKWTFIWVCTAYEFLSFWHCHKDLYLV